MHGGKPNDEEEFCVNEFAADALGKELDVGGMEMLFSSVLASTLVGFEGLGRGLAVAKLAAEAARPRLVILRVVGRGLSVKTDLRFAARRGLGSTRAEVTKLTVGASVVRPSSSLSLSSSPVDVARG